MKIRAASLPDRVLALSFPVAFFADGFRNMVLEKSLDYLEEKNTLGNGGGTK